MRFFNMSAINLLRKNGAVKIRISLGRCSKKYQKNDDSGRNNVKKTTNRTFATTLLVLFQDKSS